VRFERVLFTVCLNWIMGCAAAQGVAQGVLTSHDCSMWLGSLKAQIANNEFRKAEAAISASMVRGASQPCVGLVLSKL
jgi:hypothetical protein